MRAFYDELVTYTTRFNDNTDFEYIDEFLQRTDLFTEFGTEEKEYLDSERKSLLLCWKTESKKQKEQPKADPSLRSIYEPHKWLVAIAQGLFGVAVRKGQLDNDRGTRLKWLTDLFAKTGEDEMWLSQWQIERWTEGKPDHGERLWW